MHRRLPVPQTREMVRQILQARAPRSGDSKLYHRDNTCDDIAIQRVNRHGEAGQLVSAMLLGSLFMYLC